MRKTQSGTSKRSTQNFKLIKSTDIDTKTDNDNNNNKKLINQNFFFVTIYLWWHLSIQTNMDTK